MEELEESSNSEDQKLPLPHCIGLTEGKIGHGNGLA